MSICDEQFDPNCDECYVVAKADNALVFSYGFDPNTQYYLWVIDKFKNSYKKLITTDGAGAFTIDPTDTTYPSGMFNPYAGAFDIFLSSDADGVNVVPFTIDAVVYNCIVLTISSSTEINCSTPSLPGCAPAYVTDGAVIFEVASGEAYTCTPCGVCDDATVTNSSLLFSQAIPSGDTYALADYVFNFYDTGNNLIATETGAAMDNEIFTVNALFGCTPFYDYNLYINGVFQQVVQVDGNSDINININ